MCRNIYLDEFPCPKDGKATKDEEDEFLLRRFDAATLQSHGGAFLKQALYAIAKYNHDGVAEFAAAWAKKHHEEENILTRVHDDGIDARGLFTAEEASDYNDLFLIQVRCTIKRVNPLQGLPETTHASHSDPLTASAGGNQGMLAHKIRIPHSTWTKS